MIRKLLIIVCILTMGALAYAQEANKTVLYNTLISVSDLIVIGTVNDVKPLDSTRFDTTGGPARLNFYVADIKVDKLLKGPKVDQFSVNYSVFNNNPQLEVKSQKIFFLHRIKGGYAFSNYFDVCDPDQADAVEKAIKDFPVKLKLESKLTPFFFGEPVELELIITNNSASPIEISKQYSFVAESYILSSMLTDYLPVSQTLLLPGVEEPANAEGPAVTKNVTIGAGEKFTARLKVTYSVPQSWQFLTKETYLQMPVALRFVMRTNVMRDANDKVIPGSQYNVATSLMTAMVGYPLPDEAINIGAGDAD